MEKSKSDIARSGGQLNWNPSSVLPSDTFRSGLYVGIHHCTGGRLSTQQPFPTVILHVKFALSRQIARCLPLQETMAEAPSAAVAHRFLLLINCIMSYLIRHLRVPQPPPFLLLRRQYRKIKTSPVWKKRDSHNLQTFPSPPTPLSLETSHLTYMLSVTSHLLDTLLPPSHLLDTLLPPSLLLDTFLPPFVLVKILPPSHLLVKILPLSHLLFKILPPSHLLVKILPPSQLVFAIVHRCDVCEKNSFPAFGWDFDPNPGGSILRVDLPYLPIC
jgi:hypothetical protein